MMTVAVCTLELMLPFSHSLKDKRQVVQSIINRMRQRFNLSVAEVEALDNWQRAVISMACISNELAYAEGVLARAIDWLEKERPDLEIASVNTETW